VPSKGFVLQSKLDYAANLLPIISDMYGRPKNKSKKRQPWPRIKQVVNHGKTVYLCDARIKGRGERRFFETKKEAEGWHLQQRAKRQNERGKAFDDRELAAYGWNVADAIRFALEHLRKQTASVPLKSAVNELIEAKKGAARSERYCKGLRLRLGRLCAAFDNKTIAQISTADLEAFLSGLNLASETRNTFRRDIRTLWHFSEKRGWATATTARNTEIAKTIAAPPGVLTPEQAAALLMEPKDNDLLALHAIGLFAGLRVAEIKALDWKDVDLAGGFIHVGAGISKTRSRRLVPILENLWTWLQPIAKPSGPVLLDPDTRYRHEGVRRRAGMTEWPDNAMRHSFVSYRLAATQNAPQTALESGHDQAVYSSTIASSSDQRTPSGSSLSDLLLGRPEKRSFRFRLANISFSLDQKREGDGILRALPADRAPRCRTLSSPIRQLPAETELRIYPSRQKIRK
jgi:integrase